MYVCRPHIEIVEVEVQKSFPDNKTLPTVTSYYIGGLKLTYFIYSQSKMWDPCHLIILNAHINLKNIKFKLEKKIQL